MSVNQSRNFCGVTYLDTVTLQNLFYEKIKSGVLRSYVFALHDQDVNDDGSLKVAHIHFIIRLFNPSRLKSIQNWFTGVYGVDLNGEIQNTLPEVCIDVESMFRYLLHLDNPEKFQYNESILVSNDLNDYKINIDCDNSFLALDMMLRGYDLKEICRKFGRDFIYHYSHYKKLYDDITHQERNLK